MSSLLVSWCPPAGLLAPCGVVQRAPHAVCFPLLFPSPIATVTAVPSLSLANRIFSLQARFGTPASHPTTLFAYVG